MNQNPNQRFQQQVQQQQQQRQRQMAGYAWQQEQKRKAQAGELPRERGGCARSLAAIGTFVGTLIVLGLVCGGIGFLGGGILGESDDTAMLGAVLGGVVALIGAFISAGRAANN